MNCIITSKSDVAALDTPTDEWLIEFPEGVEVLFLGRLSDVFPDAFDNDGKVRADRSVYIRLSKPILARELLP